MKRYLVVALALLLVGCSSSNKEQNPVADNTKVESTSDKVVIDEASNKDDEKDKEDEALYPTSISISTKVSEPVGDRTADNVGQENGDYFAIGSDIVKCSDYDNIHITAEITNNRDELFNTSIMAWSAKMDDGYKLDFNTNDYSNIQIQSGGTAKVELDILKEKTVKGDKIILTYTDINYDDTYNEFLQKALSGATEEDCRKAYPQYFDESIVQEFEINIQ